MEDVNGVKVINCTQDAGDQTQFDYNGYFDRLKAKEATKKELAEMADVIFKEASPDVKTYAKFVMSLNHLLWHHYNNGNERVARWYDELWRKYDHWAYRHFKGSDLSWYVQFLD